MKLYYTPNSPYARMCRITAIEGGLGDALELDWVPLRTPDSPILGMSPLGRVPLLVDDDLMLTEGRHICAYLDEKAGRQTVAPYGDWAAVAAEAQSLAFLDAATVWAREVRRPPGVRSAAMLAAEEAQIRRYLAHLDATLAVPEGRPPISFDTLCVVAGLGMIRLYDLVPNWRDRYPTVAAWSDAYDALDSVASTAPREDAIRPLTR